LNDVYNRPDWSVSGAGVSQTPAFPLHVSSITDSTIMPFPSSDIHLKDVFNGPEEAVSGAGDSQSPAFPLDTSFNAEMGVSKNLVFEMTVLSHFGKEGEIWYNIVLEEGGAPTPVTYKHRSKTSTAIIKYNQRCLQHKHLATPMATVTTELTGDEFLHIDNEYNVKDTFGQKRGRSQSLEDDCVGQPPEKKQRKSSCKLNLKAQVQQGVVKGNGGKEAVVIIPTEKKRKRIVEPPSLTFQTRATGIRMFF
jgi:hypothetical protein